jgi:glycosyltransferase involved in cell wall biosynthesis
MRIALITDAWPPQVNGVVRTLGRTVKLLEEQGHELLLITPQLFRTFPLPTYPDIPVSILPGRKVTRMLDEFQPQAIHIATEGTIGWAARRYCLKRKLRYTSAYHTRFPEYVRLRAPIPLAWSYAFMRKFHRPAARTMVATPSLQRELEQKGFRNMARWSRGVDIERFRPQSKETLKGERPAFLYLGRVAVEKNIEAFLELRLPGQKYVVGGGPALDDLTWRFPDVEFLGHLENGELVDALAAADVMVFPSRTDTFGLVMLEAMACGVPVAAFPAPGPIDVIQNGRNGWVDEDLRSAALKALEVDRDSCRRFAEENSWEACTKQFLHNLSPAFSEAFTTDNEPAGEKEVSAIES